MSIDPTRPLHIRRVEDPPTPELTNADIVELLMAMRQSDLRVVSLIEKKLGLQREVKCPHCGKRHKEIA